MVRMIATARILMPARDGAAVRRAGMQMSEEAQLLCMMAGANSIFFGEKLLTTGNPEYDAGHGAAREGRRRSRCEPNVRDADERLSRPVATLGASEELAALAARGLRAARSSRSSPPQGAGGRASAATSG